MCSTVSTSRSLRAAEEAAEAAARRGGPHGGGAGFLPAAARGSAGREPVRPSVASPAPTQLLSCKRASRPPRRFAEALLWWRCYVNDSSSYAQQIHSLQARASTPCMTKLEPCLWSGQHLVGPKTCLLPWCRRFERQACEVLRQASVRRRQAAAAKACCMCLRRRRISSQVSDAAAYCSLPRRYACYCTNAAFDVISVQCDTLMAAPDTCHLPYGKFFSFSHHGAFSCGP